MKRFLAEDRREESDRWDSRRLLGVRLLSPNAAERPSGRWRRGDPSLDVDVAKVFGCSIWIEGIAICVVVVVVQFLVRMSQELSIVRQAFHDL